MKFTEFRRKCLDIRWHYNCNFHVAIHQSVFGEFWINIRDIRVFKCSKLRKEHVHLLIYSDQWQNCWGMRGEKIANDQHYKFIVLNYFSRKSQRHNFLCHIEFGIPSLMRLSLKTVLSRVSHVSDLTCLGFSQTILGIISKHCETLIQIPYHENDSFLPLRYLRRDQPIHFSEIDKCIEKNIVSMFQTKAVLYFWGSFIISFDYIADDGRTIPKCQKCIQLEGVFPRSLVYRRKPVKPYIQNPQNWCHVCKQVPLFVILTYDTFLKLSSYASKRARVH